MATLTIIDPPLPLQLAAPLRSAQRHWLIGAILSAHLLLLWGALQLETVRRTVAQAAPVMVRLVTLTRPDLPEPAPIPPRPQRLPQAPVLEIPLLQPLPAIPPPEVPVTVPPAPAITAVVAAAPAPPPVPAPAAAPSPRMIPPDAVRYQAPPPLEVPLASRRLGETGTVVLRVLIGRDGLPKQVNVHQSSGYARLDEQAVSAMWQARFKPHQENGLAVEAIALAACQYELD